MRLPSYQRLVSRIRRDLDQDACDHDVGAHHDGSSAAEPLADTQHEHGADETADLVDGRHEALHRRVILGFGDLAVELGRGDNAAHDAFMHMHCVSTTSHQWIPGGGSNSPWSYLWTDKQTDRYLRQNTTPKTVGRQTYPKSRKPVVHTNEIANWRDLPSRPRYGFTMVSASRSDFGARVLFGLIEQVNK